MKNKLINAILEFASDEFETKEDIIKLAHKSEEELVDELINITRYYFNEYND